ncbi:MAG: hypothetical protein ACFB20_12680 [Opitutales bacterium]
MKPILARGSRRAVVATFLVLTALTSVADASRLTTARAVVQQFEKAHGSREGWNAISSMRWLGTLVQGESEYELVLARKRPNLLRFSLKRDDVRLVFGYDGERAWLQRYFEGIPVDAQILEDVQAARIRREAEFDWPYFQLMDPLTRVGLKGTAQVNGREAYQLNVETDLVKELDLFLDAEDFRIVRTTVVEEGPTEAEDDDVLIVDSYSETVRVMVPLSDAESDIPFPKHLQTTIDGDPDNQVEWDAVDVNIGLFDSYFRMPPQLQEATPGEVVNL